MWKMKKNLIQNKKTLSASLIFDNNYHATNTLNLQEINSSAAFKTQVWYSKLCDRKSSHLLSQENPRNANRIKTWTIHNNMNKAWIIHNDMNYSWFTILDCIILCNFLNTMVEMKANRNNLELFLWFNGSQLTKMKKSIPDMSLP